jgi:ABC-type transport system involved in multi-copper enzyme maturation permease subunit
VKGTLAIALREFWEKRFVLIAAAVLATTPFLLTLIPTMRNYDARQVIVTTAAFLSVGFALGLAIVLGATVVTRDLTERRLSFYFARPVSPAAIWFGKMGASLALVFITFAILFGPSIAFASDAWRRSWNVELRLFVGLVLLCGVVLLFFTHVLWSMVRARSALLLVDFVMAMMLVAGWFAIVLWLVTAGAAVAVAWAAGVMGAAIVLIAIVAGWYQLARGRVDGRQGHRALSTIVWCASTAVLALGALFVLWLRSATVADLTQLRAVEQPSQGPWALIIGRARHRLDYQPAFIVNTENGSSERLGSFASFHPVFSPNGRSLAWIERIGFPNERLSLFTRSLEPHGATADSGIAVMLSTIVVLSDDGSRIAAIDPGSSSVAIHEPATRKLLGSFRVPVPKTWKWWSWFDGTDRLHLVIAFGPENAPANAAPDVTIRMFDYAIATRTLRQTGETHIGAKAVVIKGNVDGSRLLVRGYGGREAGTTLRLIDGVTASTLAVLPPPELGIWDLLSDGTIAVGRAAGQDAVLEIRDANGKTLRALALPRVTRLYAIGEVAPGKLALAAYHGDGHVQAPKDWSVLLIDTAAARVVRSETLGPLYLRVGSDADPRRPLFDAPPLFRAADGALVRWNPLTGARKTIVP